MSTKILNTYCIPPVMSIIIIIIIIIIVIIIITIIIIIMSRSHFVMKQATLRSARTSRKPVYNGNLKNMIKASDCDC